MARADITHLSLGRGGATWDLLLVPDVPYPAVVDLVCLVSLAASRSDEAHTVLLSLADPQGDLVVPVHRETLHIADGRSDRPGAGATVTLEIDWQVTLPSVGRYVLTAVLEGQPRTRKEVHFDVRLHADAAPTISEEELNIFDEEMGLIG